MSRKTQLDKATEQVEEAEDSGWMPSLIHAIDHEAVLKALKQAKRDKARLDWLVNQGDGDCELFVNVRTGWVNISRSRIDKAMRQSK